MNDETNLDSLRRSVTPQVMAVPGVSGIGAGKNALRIYLETDSDEVRSTVQEMVRKVDSTVPIEFAVTGKFSASN